MVYTNLGTSKGMQIGIDMAKKSRRNIEYRSLEENWEEVFSMHERNHSHKGVWGFRKR